MARKKPQSKIALKKRNLKIQDASDQQQLSDDQLNAVVGGSMLEPCLLDPCVKSFIPCVKTFGIKKTR